jgi:hypothetical protein
LGRPFHGSVADLPSDRQYFDPLAAAFALELLP